jgi:hypothetical protein
MGYERSPYKREVPESQAGLGTRLGGIVITGAHWSCKPKVGIRLPLPPPSGHGLVAEFDIASVEARVRFPLTAPCGCSSMVELRSSKPKTPVRFRSPAPSFRGVAGRSSSRLGTVCTGFNYPHPDQDSGSGLVLKAPVSGTGDRGLKSRLPDQIIAGEWNGQPREPHKLEDNGFDSGARYHFLPSSSSGRIPDSRSGDADSTSAGGTGSWRSPKSSSPCHGEERGFKSCTARQFLWPVRLSVGWLIFNQSRRVRLPHRPP